MPNDTKSESYPKDDPKVIADWQAVEARRAELNSRVGGDARRQDILNRLGMLKEAS